MHWEDLAAARDRPRLDIMVPVRNRMERQLEEMRAQSQQAQGELAICSTAMAERLDILTAEMNSTQDRNIQMRAEIDMSVIREEYLRRQLAQVAEQNSARGKGSCG